MAQTIPITGPRLNAPRRPVVKQTPDDDPNRARAIEAILAKIAAKRGGK